MAQIFHIDMARPGEAAAGNRARPSTAGEGQGDAFRKALQGSEAAKGKDAKAQDEGRRSQDKDTLPGHDALQKAQSVEPRPTPGAFGEIVPANRSDGKVQTLTASPDQPQALPESATPEAVRKTASGNAPLAETLVETAKLDPTQNEAARTSKPGDESPIPARAEASVREAGSHLTEKTGAAGISETSSAAIAPVKRAVLEQGAGSGAANMITRDTAGAGSGTTANPVDANPVKAQAGTLSQTADATRPSRNDTSAIPQPSANESSRIKSEPAFKPGLLQPAETRATPAKATIPDETATQATAKASSAAVTSQQAELSTDTQPAPRAERVPSSAPRDATGTLQSGDARMPIQTPSGKDAARAHTRAEPMPEFRHTSAEAPSRTDVQKSAEAIELPPARHTETVRFSDAPVDKAFASITMADSPATLAGAETTASPDRALQGVSAVQTAPASAQAQAPAPHINAAMRAQTMVAATPGEIVDIVQNKLAGNDSPDRIVVQLDPPELGRVSIDFKFDAQGLQHITVTGETPEALKQIRQMHYHLTQALEQHGLSGQDMSFQQQFARQDQKQGAQQPFASFGEATSEEGLPQPDMPALAQRAPGRTMSGGLDLKV